MNDENKSQEEVVQDFIQGKTNAQVIEAIHALADKEKDEASRGFVRMCNTLGVQSGDNACYHTANPEWDAFIDLQGKWIAYIASREIRDYLPESQSDLADAIYDAFPDPPRV